MLLNYSSLMIAVAFSGAALSATLLASWMSSRSENFLLSWAIGALFVVGAAWGFSYYTQFHNPLMALASMSSLVLGLNIVYAAGRHFRTRSFPTRLFATTSLVTLVPMIAAFVSGYDGVGMVLANVFSASLLFLTTWEYWLGRREAPLQIGFLMGLYSSVGVTFVLCAMMIGLDTPLVMEGPPQNWAENANAIASIIGITGVGAISLSLHQSRVALRHRSDARTDPLTGLHNRRAMFDRHEMLPAGTAVILFDIDHFKTINDVHGHAAGDLVLQQFADVLRENRRSTDMTVRLGGEEFALVMTRTNADLAAMVADNIRVMFANLPFGQSEMPFRCTLSAGVALALADGERLNDALGRADMALYRAKREGRNCVRRATDDADTVTSGVVQLPVRNSRTGGR